MKVAVQCDSALLQRSLELFLEDRLSSLKQCDVVLRDKEVMDSYQSLYISSSEDSDIRKPFSRAQLYLALQKHQDKKEEIQKVKEYAQEIETEIDVKANMKDSYSSLEAQLDLLTQEYKNNLLKTIKAFYE